MFASGVSNSQESDPVQFQREADMLAEALQRCTGRFVYFSTCSVTDEDRATTPYAVHKRRMEALIQARGNHLILRLPQVVGNTDNPHTLVNHLVAHIRAAQPLSIWSHAVRCLIDVDHIAAITLRLLDNGLELDRTLDLAPPEAVTLQQLLVLVEETLGQRATYTLVDRGGGATPDPTTFSNYASRVGIDISPGYTRRLLHKYYGADHD
nr:NAD-dependent epimerase/dehydratase family protein [uncultured Stenotrophomonas sp.]